MVGCECGGKFAVSHDALESFTYWCALRRAWSSQIRKNEDCKDGTYIVSWVPPAPGEYEIFVNFKGTFGGVAGPVRGSPVTASFQMGQPAENNTMSGPAMVAVTQADISALLQFATKAS